MTERIYLAANNCDMGGGEVMLLALAEAARQLDRPVTVVGPENSAVLDAAWQADFPVVAIKGSNRRVYMTNLRGWDLAARNGLLWCNGLVPAMATAGRRRRVVHVHLLPVGKNLTAFRIARVGAELVVVPSQFVADEVPGSVVLNNWTPEVKADVHSPGRVPATVGFLGRPSVAKGVDVLASAVKLVNQRNPDRVKLLVAGEPHFVSAKERLLVDEALASLGTVAHRAGHMDLADFFSQVDLAVFPSRVAETFGLVAAEAMSARVPFVISDAGALPEVAGAQHPWVARTGDAESLADVIQAALDDRDPAPQQRAHDRWRDLFSPEAGRERLGELLVRVGA